MSLPIDALESELRRAVEDGPVVVSAPTGSGKSTQIPRWLPGQVVVVEPRRVACRSLAARVAELEGVALGKEVGYRVRDESRAGTDTRILFVTPGIALRDPSLVARADALVLDELHERRLDVDLLLGLHASRPRLVVMSATLDGDRVAAYLGGRWLEGQGRAHPVSIRYRADGNSQPSAKELASRVVAAVDAASELPGDVLVFLPGRGEIAMCHDRLRDRRDLNVLELHGGLSMGAQSRAFARSERRKIVLATNVAETSVTIPGIGVVIDSGLVRRTRYHKGRGFLTLSAVASDSAEQRTGRAGRTGPGVCLRLWSEAAILEPRTPPEIHRESLVPMMLAAAHAGARLESLRLLDPPKPYALESARTELDALGAIDVDGGLTALGRDLFAQPLDAPHARLLIEAQRHPELLGDVIDLVSVLAVGRPLFTGSASNPDDDLRDMGCDVVAMIEAVRRGKAREHGLSSFVLAEARRTSGRLRRAHGLDEPSSTSLDRAKLARLFLRADPRLAHVARRRKKGRIAFANGGTELELGRESAANRVLEKVEALLVLETRALGLGRRDTVLIATCAMPAPLAWLRDAKVGRERVAKVALKRGALIATVERVFAKRVIDTREEEPFGELAREALLRGVLEGRLFPEALETARERLTLRELARRLARAGFEVSGVPLEADIDPVPTVEAYLEARIGELGVERGEDVALLSAEDLFPDDVASWVRDVLDEQYPRTFELGDASYAIDYDLDRRQVVMRMVRGSRTTAPPLSYLPRFPGFRICVESARSMHVVRER